MTDFKPMLASPFEKSTVQYPSLASPKLDGIRCCIVGGHALTRSLKPIPNKYIRESLSRLLYSGFDGEIIVGEPNDHDVYNRTNSAVMSHDGTPDFTFYVFDDFTFPNTEFRQRTHRAGLRILDLYQEAQNAHSFCRLRYHEHLEVEDDMTIDFLEGRWLEEGFEGIMVRCAKAPYKFGRATPKSGHLIKKKNFTDGEFEITGFEELMHNENEAFENELGRTARSKAKEGLRGSGVLGAFLGRDLESGQSFKVGTGFDSAFREWAWNNRKQIIGAIGIYKSFKIGVKDAPRHPVWKGFRDKRDMS